MNCWKFVKFVNIFPRQNFAPYGNCLLFMYTTKFSNRTYTRFRLTDVTLSYHLIIQMKFTAYGESNSI